MWETSATALCSMSCSISKYYAKLCKYNKIKKKHARIKALHDVMKKIARPKSFDLSGLGAGQKQLRQMR